MMDKDSPTLLVRVWLFGAFQVERRDGDECWETIEKVHWEKGYTRSLFKRLLSANGRRLERLTLIDDLWPDPESPELVERYLNDAAYKLRKALRPAEVLKTFGHGSGYQLVGQSLLWIDTDACEALMGEAERIGRTSASALPLLEQARAYFARGDFLEGESGLWVYARQGTLERLRYRCLIWLAEAYEQQGMMGQAEMVYNAQLEDSPADEDVLCRLMGLLHRQGMTSQALHCYEETRKRLKHLGQRLSPATDAFAKRLLSEPRQVEVYITQKIQKPHSSESVQPIILPAGPSIEEVARENVTLKTFNALLSATMDRLSLLEASIDCAIRFGLKQTHIARVINQYIGNASSCSDLQHTVDQEIRAFAITGQQYSSQEYTLSRRQALIAIAYFPLPLLLQYQHDQLPSTIVEEILPRCAASITVCWHLSRGSEVALIAQIIPSYLPLISSLAQKFSPYQKIAASLAAQCYMLLGIAALHRLDLQEREKHLFQAIRYSRIAEESHIEAAALMYLGYTYGYNHRSEQAIQTFSKALQYSDKPSQLSPLLISDICMGLAEAYAQCHQEDQAVKTITLAQERFPTYPELDSNFLYADCGLSSLYTYEGKMYLGLGKAREAQQIFAQIDRLQRGAIFSERNQTVRVIFQAQAALGLEDLEMCCVCLEKGWEGAIALNSKRMSSEVFDVYQLVREKWPREERIRTLARHFAAISRKSEE